MGASGTIEYASQGVASLPRDSYTDDILNLVKATKHRIESLYVEQIWEQSRSAEVSDKNAFLVGFEKPATTEEVLGEEEEEGDEGGGDAVHNVYIVQ